MNRTDCADVRMRSCIHCRSYHTVLSVCNESASAVRRQHCNDAVLCCIQHKANTHTHNTHNSAAHAHVPFGGYIGAHMRANLTVPMAHASMRVHARDAPKFYVPPLAVQQRQQNIHTAAVTALGTLTAPAHACVPMQSGMQNTPTYRGRSSSAVAVAVGPAQCAWNAIH